MDDFGNSIDLPTDIGSIDSFLIGLDSGKLFNMLSYSKNKVLEKLDDEQVLDDSDVARMLNIYWKMQKTGPFKTIERNISTVMRAIPKDQNRLYEILGIRDDNLAGPFLITDSFIYLAEGCIFAKGFDGIDKYKSLDLESLANVAFRKAIKICERVSKDDYLLKLLEKGHFDFDSLFNFIKHYHHTSPLYVDVFTEFSGIFRKISPTGDDNELHRIKAFLPLALPEIVEKPDDESYYPAISSTEPKQCSETSLLFEIQQDPVKYLSDLEQKLLFMTLDFDNIALEMKQRVKGQDNVIDEMLDSILLKAVGTTDHYRPTNFFCIGPTGVGKNYIPEQLAALLGSLDIKVAYREINCSSFESEGSTNSLIGSPKGYIGHDDEGILTLFYEQAKNAPFSILVFDEFEKSDKKIIEFLLPVMDKGGIYDTKDQYLDLRNTIIFFTSNLGYSNLRSGKRNSLGFSADSIKSENTARKDYVKQSIKSYFPPEFLNRIKMLHFNPLSKEAIHDIFDLEFKKIASRYTENYALDVSCSKGTRKYLISQGFNDEYGARHLRTILENVLNVPLSRLVRSDTHFDDKGTAEMIDYLRHLKNCGEEFQRQKVENYFGKVFKRTLPYRKIYVDVKDDKLVFRK